MGDENAIRCNMCQRIRTCIYLPNWNAMPHKASLINSLNFTSVLYLLYFAAIWNAAKLASLEIPGNRWAFRLHASNSFSTQFILADLPFDKNDRANARINLFFFLAMVVSRCLKPDTIPNIHSKQFPISHLAIPPSFLFCIEIYDLL